MAEGRYAFEDIPEDRRYWFLVRWGMPPDMEEAEDIEESRSVFGTMEPELLEADKRAEEIGYAPGLLDPPWWSDVEYRWEHNQGPEYVSAPALFTTKEAAEQVLREIEAVEPESYLSMVERYGQADTDEAFDNASPLRVVWTDRDSLLYSLTDADFLCVKIDDQLKLRQDFMEELRSKLAEEEQ